MVFSCVLSSIWSDRNHAHSGFCLEPGAGGRGLAPQGGISGHNMSSRGRISHFWGSFWCFGGTWGKSIFDIPVEFWCPRGVGGVPQRCQNGVSVRFELHLERSKSRPFRTLPWARSWRARSGTPRWPLGPQKCRPEVGFYIFGVHFGVLVAHGKSRFLTF